MSTTTMTVDPGDPHNDQMLARVRDDLRDQLDTTIHPLIDQGEAKDAPLSSLLAAVAVHWIESPDYMPRDRLVSLLALALVTLASEEREIVGPGRTVRR